MKRFRADLISAYEYAKRKGVSPKAVYNKMRTEKNPNGDIKTVPAGKQHFIDWDTNKDVEFKVGRKQVK